MNRITVLVTLLILMGAHTVAAAPSSDGTQYWSAHDKASTRTIGHSIWNSILARHLTAHSDGINRMDYAGLIANSRTQLEAYINMMTSVKITSLNRDEQRAYWINLYNALTVKVIVAHYPVKSIKKINISPGLFNRGPWDAQVATIESKRVSLNDIEHRILRPLWRDARIHYALNCASIGCPILQQEAFTVGNAESLLSMGAAQYINHPRGVSFKGSRLHVSSIYKWYKEDFGGSDEGVITHLMKYAQGDIKARLSKAKKIFG